MLRLGEQEIKSLFLGNQEIKKAYLGNELVFQRQEAKTIAVTVADSTSVSSLLAAGTLTVGDKQVKSVSTQITTNQSTVDVSFILTKTIKIARTMSVNGVDTGHVEQEGDSVSTTLPAQDGMTISVSFTNYVAPAPTYTITATIDPSGSGTVTGAGQYQEGETITLAATPADGYKFTGWQEGGQVVSSDNPYTFTAAADRALVSVFAAKVPSRLPGGYTEVEYVQSSGGARIDTDISPYVFYHMDMDIEILETTSTYSRYVFYSYYQKNSTNNYFCYLYVSKSGGFKGSLGLWSQAPAQTVNSNATPRRATISIDRLQKCISVDDKKYTWGNATMMSTVPGIKLLSSSLTVATRGLDAKLYSVKFDKSGTTVADLVPCVNPSGAVGLYDLVGSKFYGNAGTGVLSAGPAV